LLSIGPGQEAG